MIVRALALKDALNTYAVMLNVSTDELNKETFKEDYLSDTK
jgi:hypothetical protein